MIPLYIHVAHTCVDAICTLFISVLSVCGYDVDFAKLVVMQELFSTRESYMYHQTDQIIVFDSAIIELFFLFQP